MSQDYLETYYRDTLHDNQKRASLSDAIDAEICVVGGGLAGISTALGLAEKGKKVVVVEANRVGWGASGRNGGFVAKGFSASYDRLKKSAGLEFAKELHTVAEQGKALIKERIRTYEIDCAPVRDGVLQVSWGGNVDAKREYVLKMKEDFDIDLEFLDTQAVRELCKTDKYTAGCLSMDDFQFHPLNYLQGIAKAFERLGGFIFEETKATKIWKGPNRFRVETDNGQIRCDQVVLCTSAYVGNLSRRLALSSIPIYTFVMVTKPIPDEKLAQAINTRHAIIDDRYAQDYYRVLPDNRILWGGRVSLSKKSSHLADVMLKDLLKVYPQLKGIAEPEYAWHGTMCYASHKMPQIGKLEEGKWFATCFGGHGLVPTSVGGDLISSAIADGDERYRLFDRYNRFSFTGGSLGRYAAQAIYYWWRLRDYVKF